MMAEIDSCSMNEMASNVSSSLMNSTENSREENSRDTDGFNDLMSNNVVEEKQVGVVLMGPGARKDQQIYDLPKLTSLQKENIQKAKKYAMEQSIRTVLLKQTITHQQQQMMNLQNSIQRQQAVALMCRVYIGSINFEIKEEMIRQAFLPFGPIKSMSMPYDTVGKHHKGFAFLEYETPEAAALCLDQMNGIMISGYTIKVCKVGRPSNMPQAQIIIDKIMEESKSYNRIYVAAIHPDLTENDIKSVFEAFGRITHCQLAPDPNRPNKHKGYGYLEFELLQSALDAVMGMNLFDLGGQHLRVGRAITPPNAFTPPPTSGSLPTASAIAAAAITAKITALEAISKPVGVVEINPSPLQTSSLANDENSNSPATSSTRQRTSKFGGFSSGPGSTNVPPPSIYIPPTTLVNSASTSTSSTSKRPPTKGDPNSKSSSDLKKKLEIMAEMSELADIQTLQQQEDIQIKGHQARHMVMQKLLRKKESRVMVLQNMVGPEDVDEELEHEVTDECSKFGEVEKVVIYQEKQGEDDDAPIFVKIFVEFKHPTGVEAAVSSLNGRFFAGRTVSAKRYDQDLYDNNDFSA
ncbi:hypothetical protein HELRODRAFT_108224, partial [Helobdella robusta]|uniref:RRM domain-containing protein n=1 Tax=Helobdella robusta TaxID=6412 RepID=T1EEH1_HELRO